MSHDGCHEVAWKGKAFPYLMHHSGFHSTENYGTAKAQRDAGHGGHGHGGYGGSSGGHGGYGHAAPAAGHGGYGHAAPAAAADGESVFTAGTGTWNGPAPRGSAAFREQAAKPKPATGPVHEPEFVRLSNNMKLPLIGMGLAGVQSADSIKQALSLGYRLFDSAAFYGNEQLVGEGLKDFVAAGRRDELFLVSKVWNTHHRPELVRASCQKTLQDLGVQQLDLFLVHWPEAWPPGTEWVPGSDTIPPVDTAVTMEQTWAAMEALVDDGLVKAIGVSNFSLAQVEQLLASARIKPVVNQIEMHPYLAQRKLVGVQLRKGVVSMAYSPLGGASLFIENTLLGDATVLRVAKECGKSPAQVLLRWNMQRGVPVIPKASSEPHLKENLDGCFSWRLSNEHKALLDTLDRELRFVNTPWKVWAPAEEGGVTKPSTVVF